MPPRKKPTSGAGSNKPAMVSTGENIGAHNHTAIIAVINSWLARNGRPFVIDSQSATIRSNFYARADVKVHEMLGNRFYKVEATLTCTAEDIPRAIGAHLTRLTLLDIVFYVRRFPYKVSDHAGEFVPKKKTNRGGRPKGPRK